MFCYKCAAQNTDDARFCRSCGTTLEIISLALTGKLVRAEESEKEEKPAAETMQKKYSKTIKKLSAGGLLMTVSLLLLFVPMLFIPVVFPWLIIWTIFLGWMLVYGTTELASGIGAYIDYKTMIGELDQNKQELESATGFRLFSSIGKRRVTSPSLPSPQMDAPASVTEPTTRILQVKSGQPE